MIFFFFFFCSQLLKHPLIELCHFPICFKHHTTVEGSMLSSGATSHVVVTAPALMTLSADCCHFWRPATVLLIFKAAISFAKRPEPPLHCMFISSSWAKSVVNVASCLCCFIQNPFWTPTRKLLNVAFCLTSFPWSKIHIK